MRDNAKNFGSELDDLRIAQGDQTVLQQREQKRNEVPSYMTDDDSFNNLSVAPITGSEESLGGYNAFLQTNDDDKIAFAGVTGLTNQEILFAVENGKTSLFKDKRKEAASGFASDLDALASQTDPSYVQKGLGKSFRSFDDNLKVKDLAYDELPSRDSNLQISNQVRSGLTWDLEDAMTTQVSNNEILGEVYLPDVEKIDDHINQMYNPVSFSQH